MKYVRLLWREGSLHALQVGVQAHVPQVTLVVTLFKLHVVTGTVLLIVMPG